MPSDPPPTRIRPVPCPEDRPHRLVFTRGKNYPRAIAWLGFSSFWGHLWHLAASVIATEDIDARDWMQADAPEELTDHIARLLRSTIDDDTGLAAPLNAPGDDDEELLPSLTEALDDDLWIDFVADTGDDADVSEAVADMMFQSYTLPEMDTLGGGDIVAPRGRLLLFGGDTAYPVATDLEIHNRVSVPFNRVLRHRLDGQPRVLLGIPGNHDWYNGLDGFARMFRLRRGNIDPTTLAQNVDRAGQIGHLIDWVEAFRVGRFVVKRAALPLFGYTPVQNASYFALRLAPGLDLWGVDRQLRQVDYSQRGYFAQLRNEAPGNGLVLLSADPAYSHLEPNAPGLELLEAVDVDLKRDGPLYLTGDLHHYCRQELGAATHVIAGGGGAFLHPACIWRGRLPPPEAELPGPRASLALALQVPWQIAAGRSGYMVHTGITLMYLPLLGMLMAGDPSLLASGLVGGFAALVCTLLGGWRKARALVILGLALLCGAWVGMLPYAVRHGLGALVPELDQWASAVLTVALSVYPATLGFGTYLMVLTLLGLEQHQAFASLAHPGYKHFVRLRVRKDGSAVDGWVVGKVDPLRQGEDTVLIDRFTWTNPAPTTTTRPSGSRP